MGVEAEPHVDTSSVTRIHVAIIAIETGYIRARWPFWPTLKFEFFAINS